MLNIASFLTPLAARPDPNGAVANALHARGLEYNKTQEQNQLAESTRHSKAEEGLQQGHLDLAKQEHADTMAEHERELHTKLTDWAMGVLDKEGLDKAKEIAGPVLDAAGIGVDFGGSPGVSSATSRPEAAPAVPNDEDGFAKLQAAQSARGDLSEYQPGGGGGVPLQEMTGKLPGGQAEEKPIAGKVPSGMGGESGIPLSEMSGKLSSYGPRPGESLSQYVARGTAQVAKKEPAPTTEELDKEATEGPAKAATDEVVSEAEGQPKWRLYNKRTGETYGLIDPAKVDAINQKRAASRGEAYEKGLSGKTPQEIGAGFMGGARNESDLETRYGHAEHYITQNEKTKRAALVGKGGGNGLNPKLTATLTDDQEAHVKAALTSAGVPKLQQAGNDGEKVASLAESKDPLQDKVAAGQMLKSLFGAAASEGERAFVFGSEGEFVRLQQMANNWLNGGQMPPQFAAAIRHAASRMGELARKKAHDITVRVVGNVASDPAIGFDRMGLKTPEEKEARRKTLEDLGSAGEGSSANDEASKLGF